METDIHLAERSDFMQGFIDESSERNIDVEMLRASINSEVESMELFKKFAACCYNVKNKKLLTKFAKEKEKMIKNLKSAYTRSAENRPRRALSIKKERLTHEIL